MSDHWRLSATETAAQVRAKKISAREVTQSVLARLERANPLINAVVAYDADYSLKQADAVDAKIARGEDPVRSPVFLSRSNACWTRPALPRPTASSRKKI